MQGNQCLGNTYYGILSMEGSAPLLEQNRCSSNGLGGLGFLSRAGGIARRNECIDNSQCGIFVGEKSQPQLVDNHCAENPIGLWLEWGTRARLQGNTLVGGKRIRREGALHHLLSLYSESSLDAQRLVVKLLTILLGVGMLYGGSRLHSTALLVAGAAFSVGGIISLFAASTWDET